MAQHRKSKLLELYGSKCFYCGAELPIESLDAEKERNYCKRILEKLVGEGLV